MTAAQGCELFARIVTQPDPERGPDLRLFTLFGHKLKRLYIPKSTFFLVILDIFLCHSPSLHPQKNNTKQWNVKQKGREGQGPGLSIALIMTYTFVHLAKPRTRDFVIVNRAPNFLRHRSSQVYELLDTPLGPVICRL